MNEKRPGIMAGELTGFDITTTELDRLIDEVVPFFDPDSHPGEVGVAFENYPRLRGLLDSVSGVLNNDAWIYLSEKLRRDAMVALWTRRLLVGLEVGANLVGSNGKLVRLSGTEPEEGALRKLIEFAETMRDQPVDGGDLFWRAHEAIYGQDPGVILEIEEVSDRLISHISGLSIGSSSRLSATSG